MQLAIVSKRKPNDTLASMGVISLIDVMVYSDDVPLLRINDIMIKKSKRGDGSKYVSDGVLMRSTKDGTPLRDRNGNYLYHVKFFKYLMDSVLQIYEKIDKAENPDKINESKIVTEKIKTEK